MVDFDRLNKETRDFNNRNVDRFNHSTRANYQFSTSNSYYPTRQPIATKGNGYYDGRGQWHAE